MAKDVRKIFAGSLSSLFRELPDYTADAEKEWRLFQAAVISSTSRVCGQKRLGDATDGKKITSWLNQDGKILFLQRK